MFTSRFTRGACLIAQLPRLKLATTQFQLKSFMSTEIKKAIDEAITKTPVVLFMKGTPEFPLCGFSRATITILGQQGVDPSKFAAYNVLEDPELREAIKEYTDWPTIPQLFVNGEFIGGCDIVVSMAKSGELADLLESANVLVDAEADVDAETGTETNANTETEVERTESEAKKN